MKNILCSNIESLSNYVKDLEKYPLLLPKEPSSSRQSALNYLKQNNVKIIPKMNRWGVFLCRFKRRFKSRL